MHAFTYPLLLRVCANNGNTPNLLPKNFFFNLYLFNFNKSLSNCHLINSIHIKSQLW